MFLVELVMQGVRDFRHRVRFQSGFNFIAASNEAGKTTVVDTLQRLLFPRNQPDLMERFAKENSPDGARAALTIYSNDKVYYRIIQDFTKRAVNLSKYNAATKEFVLLHKDWDSTAQLMSTMTSELSEQDYAHIFVLRREHYAASQYRGAAQSPAGAGEKSAPAQQKRQSPANEARLAELRETLRKAEEAADADYKFQSAKLALEETRKKLASVQEIEEKQAGMDRTLETLKGCEDLPENLSELIDDYERRQGQKLAEADQIGKQIEGLRMQFAEIPTVNLVTDKLFIAGGVLGILSILAGVFLLTAEQAIFFPLGILVSLMLMAGAWYKGARKSAQRSKVIKEEAELKKELEELERRFQHDSTAVTAAMRTAGASSPGDLKEKADNYRYFLSLRSDIEEQRSRLLGELDPEALRKQLEKQTQDAAELERAAREVAHNNIDTYSIRQDIERLDSEVSAASGEVAWDVGTEVPGLPQDFAAPAGTPGGFSADLAIASRLGGIEMETLVPAVEAAAQRNLSAVSGGKYVRIETGQDGVPVVHLKDNSVISSADLSHGTRALVYFCLRTGLVEALVGKRRLPFILDDPLQEFDPARQKAACQVLRTLGTKTQVVLFTSNPALKAEGDAAAELK